MNTYKIIVFVLVSLIAGIASAGTYNCTSEGEHLPKNAFNFELTLETNFLGTLVQSGSYKYRSSSDTAEHPFTCKEPNEYKIVHCDPATPDSNVLEIVSHPVMGLMFKLAAQEHVVLFSCKKI